MSEHKIDTIWQISYDLPVLRQHAGKMVIITGKLESREAYDKDGKPITLFGYSVRILGEETRLILTHPALQEPETPERGDMDDKVRWHELPAEVQVIWEKSA